MSDCKHEEKDYLKTRVCTGCQKSEREIYLERENAELKAELKAEREISEGLRLDLRVREKQFKKIRSLADLYVDD